MSWGPWNEPPVIKGKPDAQALAKVLERKYSHRIDGGLTYGDVGYLGVDKASFGQYDSDGNKVISPAELATGLGNLDEQRLSSARQQIKNLDAKAGSATANGWLGLGLGTTLAMCSFTLMAAAGPLFAIPTAAFLGWAVWGGFKLHEGSKDHAASEKLARDTMTSA